MRSRPHRSTGLATKYQLQSLLTSPCEGRILRREEAANYTFNWTYFTLRRALESDKKAIFEALDIDEQPHTLLTTTEVIKEETKQFYAAIFSGTSGFTSVVALMRSCTTLSPCF